MSAGVSSQRSVSENASGPGRERVAGIVGVSYALTDNEVALSTMALELPDELTHCWIVSSWTAGRGLVRAPGGRPWFDELPPRS